MSRREIEWSRGIQFTSTIEVFGVIVNLKTCSDLVPTLFGQDALMRADISEMVTRPRRQRLYVGLWCNGMWIDTPLADRVAPPVSTVEASASMAAPPCTSTSIATDGAGPICAVYERT